MSKKIKTKGEFTTSTKFTEFIGGKGFINFISNEATITANQLSGLELDGVNFKLTIHDDGSVDFIELDSNLTTKAQRQRLLETIEDKTISTYRNRSVIQELNFISVTKVKDKFVPLFLAVEISKPIDDLTSLLDDTLVITDSALAKLDNLFDSWMGDDFDVQDDDEQDSSDDDQDDSNHIDNTPNDCNDRIKETFTQMKEDKLKELKSLKSKKEIEIKNYKFQLKNTQNNLNQSIDDLELIENRIDDLQPTEESLGYLFFVSERQNEVIALDSKTEEIIKEKVSKIKSINLENFMKLFTDGEFHISLGQLVNDSIELVTDYKSLTEEVILKLNSLDISLSDDKFVYTGDLTWSQLVNKLIKLGFEESSEFNKLCGSNSYTPTTEESKEQIKSS